MRVIEPLNPEGAYLLPHGTTSSLRLREPNSIIVVYVDPLANSHKQVHKSLCTISNKYGRNVDDYSGLRVMLMAKPLNPKPHTLRNPQLDPKP